VKWVVYAAYRADGNQSPHVVDQLIDYRRAGWKTLLVDASPVVSAERQRDWSESATAWMQRPNIGYDFASYRDGIEHLRSACRIDIDAASLIMTNDSCFGPFIPMADIVVRLEERRSGDLVVHGITDSYEFHHHLQSYWVYSRPPAVSLVRRFLLDLPPIHGVQEAIHRGELGLSRYLAENGCALQALCPTREIIPRFALLHSRPLSILEFGLRRRLDAPRYNRETDRACLGYLRGKPDPFANVNISIGLGAEMLRAKLSPLLKRRLLAENPYDAKSIPSDLDVDSLTNLDVARLLRVGSERQSACRRFW